MESDASSVQTMGIADGNDTTPMEVDALMEGKSKNKERQRQRQRERQRKEHGQGEGKNIRHVECEVFLCKEKGHTRKDCPQFSAWLDWEENSGSREQGAKSTEEDEWIFVLDQSMRRLCELIMIDSGASVHVCPPDHGQ